MNIHSMLMDKYFNRVDNWFVGKPEETVETCIVCGEKWWSAFNNKVIYCAKCGFTWKGVQPTQEVLDEFYKDQGQIKIWNEVKSTSHEDKRQTTKYENVVSLVKLNDIQKVLDIGCGNGFFLNSLDSSVTKVGIEPGGNAHNDKFACYDSYSSFKESLHGKMKYDMITMFGVLEHLKNPKEELERYSEYLRSGGFLSIIVPNIRALVCTVLKEECSTFCPQHLWFFNASSLTRFIEPFGYRLFQWVTIEPELQPVLKKLKGLPPYADLGFKLTDKDITEENILENGLGYKIVANFIKE